MLRLQFTESACDGCGSQGAIGRCPHCGGIRPDNTETDSILTMRREALTGLAKRVAEISLELATPADGHIPCTALQFGFALTDSDIFIQWEVVVAAYKRLHDLDLGDRSVVGKTLRRRVVALVDGAAQVAALRSPLAWFVPPSCAVELQTMIWALMQAAVDLAGTTIEVLTAGQEEATRLMPELQKNLEPPIDSARFGDLLNLLMSEPDSLSDRVGVALGIKTEVVNDYGGLDFAHVFAACTVKGDPLLDLRDRVIRYLGHTVRDPGTLGPEVAILAWPAATLASLDRPLIGHRVAFELGELLRRAYARDEQLTRSLVERTLDDGPRLLAAVARDETRQRRMALDGNATRADITSDLVDLYASVAEAGFRSYAWLALNLLRLVGGETVRVADPMPMLGEIAQQLGAQDSVLTQLLFVAVNSDLRNAAKHESYSADCDGSSVSLGSGTMDEVELARLMQRMAACVAGMDAAIAAWGLESRLLMDAVPAMDTSAGSAYARRVILRSLVAASGAELVSSEWGATVTLVVAVSRPRVRANDLHLLAAVSPLCTQATRLELRDESGLQIVAASAESFGRFARAGPATSHIALHYAIFDAAVALGEDRAEAARDALAVMIRLLSPETVDEDQPHTKAETLGILEARARAAKEFVASHSLGSRQRDAEVSSRLRMAESAARAAARGDQGGVLRLSRALVPLFEWSTKRDASFGGLFQPW